MKIVIDIPESIYETIEEDQFISRYQLAVLQSQIRKGVPLPKGHGRLIDADAFIKEKTKVYCEKCDRRRGMSGGKLTEKFVYKIGDAPCRACDTGDMIDDVDDAPTIIEADKAESEGKA